MRPKFRLSALLYLHTKVTTLHFRVFYWHLACKIKNKKH